MARVLGGPAVALMLLIGSAEAKTEPGDSFETFSLCWHSLENKTEFWLMPPCPYLPEVGRYSLCIARQRTKHAAGLSDGEVMVKDGWPSKEDARPAPQLPGPPFAACKREEEALDAALTAYLKQFN